MQKIYQKILARKWEFLILTIIIGGGIFLRTFHFSSWLHFEIDQAYDLNTVSPALTNGPGSLPLLGTNVGGGQLRLGPAFYYMEYLSALFFGNTPTGHAMAVLLLNIAALPLFYLFSRRYFKTEVSLGLTALFSFSLFAVMYSRFSWSPNVLPFLTLLSFYALLRSTSKQEGHPGRWFLLAVTAVTITSHIHFNSLFIVPAIAVLFTIYKRPHFSWKVWLASIFLVFLIYSPVLANDLLAKGDNYELFQEKFQRTGKNSVFKPKVILQAIEYTAYENFFILSANDQINGIRLKNTGFDCKDCATNLPIKLLALLLFIVSFALIFFQIKKEKDANKKDFLILNLLWLLLSLYLFYTIAKVYRMYPRFYLLISPLSILMIGFILQYLKPHLSKLRLAIFSLLIIFLVGLNIQKIFSIFTQLGSVTTVANSDLENGDIFPNTNRLTYEAQLQVVEYITQKYQTHPTPTYLDIKSEYASAFWYNLEKQGVLYYDEFAKKHVYAEANYFAVKFADERQNIDPRFQVLEKKDFKTLIVYHLTAKPEAINAQRQADWDRKTSKDNILLPLPKTIKDIFNTNIQTNEKIKK